MAWFDVFLDLLYPPTCLSCEADGLWLCEECQKKVFLNHRGFCPRCGDILNQHHTCTGTLPFASLLAVGSYADPVWRRLITTYKYRSARCLEPALRSVLRLYRDTFLDAWPWAGEQEILIVPIPTDARHVQERGVDHTILQADLIQELLVPWGERQNVLRRTRKGLANASLEADEHRAANMRGMFETTVPLSSSVILVDDVLTSGATLREAGEALMRAGAKKVYGMVMAKGR